MCCAYIWRSQQLLLALRVNRPESQSNDGSLPVSLTIWVTWWDFGSVGAKGVAKVNSSHSISGTQHYPHSACHSTHFKITNCLQTTLSQQLSLLPPALTWLVLQVKALESGSYFLTLVHPGAQPTSQTALGTCPLSKAPDPSQWSFLRQCAGDAPSI